MSETLPGFDTNVVDQDNPWPGPSSFTERAAPFFRGRETEAEQLLDLIHENALVVLHAKSGLGKSSLLQAGLFPLLRREDFLPIYVRLRHRDTAEEYADEIKDDLKRAAAEANVTFEAPTKEQTLWEYFDPNRARFVTPRGRSLTPVLVFDQFEELFTLGRDRAENQERYQKFAVELSNLVENRMPVSVATRERSRALAEISRGGKLSGEAPFSSERRTCRVILSLRADFLDVLEHEFVRSIPSLTRNRFGLLPMNGRRARDAIIEAGGHLMEAGVADRIIRTVAAGAGDEEASGAELEKLEVEPSLLSIFCRELNLVRQRSGLPKITAALADVAREAILEGFYDRAFEQIAAERRETMRKFVEEKLVLKGGFRNNLALSLATEIPGVSRDDIGLLVEARLLRIEDLGKGRPKAIEITHDVLAAVAYRRLQVRHESEAQAKKREEERLRSLALEEEARQSQLRTIEAQKQRRRARKIALVSMVVAVLSLSALGWAILENYRVNLAQKSLTTAVQVMASDQRLMEALLTKYGEVGYELMPMLGTAHGQEILSKIVKATVAYYPGGPPSRDPVALQNYAYVEEENGSLNEVHEDYTDAMTSYLASLDARISLGGDAPGARMDLSRAYIHIGDLLRAGASVPDLQQKLEARLLTPEAVSALGKDHPMDNLALELSAYEKARDLVDPLVANSKDVDDTTKIAYATAHNLVGLAETGPDVKSAMKEFQAALAMIGNDKEGLDRDKDYQKSRSYSGIGSIESGQNDHLGDDNDEVLLDPAKADTSALYNYGQAVRILRALYDFDNSIGLWAYDYVGCQGSIGTIYENKGELVNKGADGKQLRAQGYYEAAQVGRAHLAALDPNRSDWQRKLAVGSDHLGDTYNAEGMIRSAASGGPSKTMAVNFYRDAFNDRERLMDKGLSPAEEALLNPDDRSASPGDAGTMADAVKQYPELSASLLKRRNGLGMTDLATSFSKLGTIDEETDDLKTAANHYGRAWYLQGLTLQIDPANLGWRSAYATMADHVGDILRLRGRYADALRSYSDSLSVRGGIVAQARKPGKQPKPQSLVDLATSYDQIGATLVLMGDRDAAPGEDAAVGLLALQLRGDDADGATSPAGGSPGPRALAATCFERARSQLALVAPDPLKIIQRLWQNEFALNDDGFGSLGKRDNTAESLAKASDEYSHCILIEGGLTTSEPENIKWKHEYGLNLFHRGEVEIAENHLSDAEKDMDSSEKIMRDLLSISGQDDGQFLHDLAEVFDRQGDIAERQGLLAHAAAMHIESIKDEETVLAKQKNWGADWVNAEWMKNMTDTFGDLQRILAALKSQDLAAYDEDVRSAQPLAAAMKALLPDGDPLQKDIADFGKVDPAVPGGSQ
jgi:tetratricopeptide (TPR) repeat protein